MELQSWKIIHLSFNTILYFIVGGTGDQHVLVTFFQGHTASYKKPQSSIVSMPCFLPDVLVVVTSDLVFSVKAFR